LVSDSTIGVVVGLAAEARIARRLGWRVSVGGGTAPGAEVAARRLADEGCDALISFGLAGGLDPALRPGDVVVPSTVILDGVHLATDPALSRLLGGATDHAIAASPAVLTSVAEKRVLYDSTSAAAVDLESGAVARIASARGIRFAVLRAICDPAERGLPPAAVATLDECGAVRVGRLIAAIAARPGQLPALFTLASDAAAARRSLVARVRRIRQALA
jgi:adenosylhomocysteine nucleosidase